MPQAIVVVDAFTATPFTGNPAAVCLLSQPASDAWMQAVAAELNLAETAFIVPQKETFSLRWFTPVAEVDLCGHATLAAAHHLWEGGTLPASESARFQTRSGLLSAVRLPDGMMQLDFPLLPVTPCEPPVGLLAALGVRGTFVGQSTFDYVVEVATEGEVRGADPDFARLSRLNARGVILTARADAGRSVDVVSRCFYPSLGIDEDPVTGSAHCALAPYWCAKLTRAQWQGEQASRRGGQVGVQLIEPRVALTGSAVTSWRGELLHGPW